MDGMEEMEVMEETFTLELTASEIAIVFCALAGMEFDMLETEIQSAKRGNAEGSAIACKYHNEASRIRTYIAASNAGINSKDAANEMKAELLKIVKK